MPARLEDDPIYRRYPEDWLNYHTRYVATEDFSTARCCRTSQEIEMKRTTVAQLISLVLLVALLSLPAVVKRLSASVAPAPLPSPGTSGAMAKSRYASPFRDVTHPRIDFTTKAPPSTQARPHHAPDQLEGAAVSIVDFDRDGWPDL